MAVLALHSGLAVSSAGRGKRLSRAEKLIVASSRARGGAEAEVDASVGHVVVVAPTEVEPLRVDKNRRIAVGGAHHRRDALAAPRGPNAEADERLARPVGFEPTTVGHWRASILQ